MNIFSTRAWLVLMSLSILYVPVFLFVLGFLPPPFLQNQSDLVGDLVSIAASGDGFYQMDRGVYLPFAVLLSKAIVSFLGFFGAVEQSEVFVGFVLISLTVNVLIVLFLKISSGFNFEFIPLLGILSLNFPIIFGWERGNLFVLIVPLFLMAWMSPSVIFKSLAMALAVSLKPFLLPLAVIWLYPALVRGSLLLCIFSVLINWVSDSVLGHQFSLHQWLKNLLQFGVDHSFPILDVINLNFSFIVTFAQFASYFDYSEISLIVNITGVAFGACLLLHLLYVQISSVAPRETVCAIACVVIVIFAPQSGGYVFSLLVLPVCLLRNEHQRMCCLLVLLLVPLDAPLFGYFGEVNTNKITGVNFEQMHFVTLGAVLRPIATLAVLLYLYIHLFSLRRLAPSEIN